MRTPHHLALLTIMLIALTGCKKDKTPPSGGGGSGGTGGTGGGGLVTSWSPVVPYPDDVVTFTGGPFNTTPGQTSIMVVNEPFEILDITATQITARPPLDMFIAAGGYNAPIITNGGVVDTIPYMFWKRPLELMSLLDNVDQFISGAVSRAGDSLVFRATGCTPGGMSLSLDGVNIPGPLAVDSDYICTIAFRLPVQFGTGSDETFITTAELRATNGDGRTHTLEIPYAPTPDMRIDGLELLGGGNLSSISALSSNGLVLNFRVYGRYLNALAPWTLSGPAPASGTLGVGGYPSEVPIVLIPGSMQPGTYILSVEGAGNLYAFTLTP